MRIRIAIAAALTLASALAHGQAPLFDGAGRPVANPATVQYLYPEQVTLPAGKEAKVALHFRVAPGMHINSHTPRGKYLIPTAFSIPAGSGVRLAAASFPPGAEFTQPLDPQTKLSVYTGEFTLQTRLVAAPGEHLIEGKLRYQACDDSRCMPPKTILAAIDVIGQ